NRDDCKRKTFTILGNLLSRFLKLGRAGLLEPPQHATSPSPSLQFHDNQPEREKPMIHMRASEFEKLVTDISRQICDERERKGKGLMTSPPPRNSPEKRG
ncbi:hypothetical protein Pfo_031295, partial [Paulownia fortunei]